MTIALNHSIQSNFLIAVQSMCTGVMSRSNSLKQEFINYFITELLFNSILSVN